MTRIYTDKAEAQGGAWASQAAQRFQIPSQASLHGFQNTSPSRSASGPALERLAPGGTGSYGGNRLAVSGEFLEGQSQAGSQMGYQKLLNPRAAMGIDTSGENSLSVLIREIRG